MDQYANVAFLEVTESAANSLTFGELNIATELDKKRAMIIHRVEYIIGTSNIAKMIAVGDQIAGGISLSDTITGTGLDRIEVFDRFSLSYDNGAQIAPIMQPIDKRFNDMPGGGLMVPVKRLYLFIQGSSLATAVAMQARIWYTIKELKTDEYLELVEAFNILK